MGEDKRSQIYDDRRRPDLGGEHTVQYTDVYT